LDYLKKHKINYTEFIGATIHMETYLTDAKLDSVFNAFDVDGNGKITKKDL